MHNKCIGLLTIISIWSLLFIDNSPYAGVLLMAQKVIEGDFVTCMKLWDGWKFELFSFSYFSSKTLRWLKIRAIFASNPYFSSNFEPEFSCWNKGNWTVRNLTHLKVTHKAMHVTAPLSMTFWAISRTSAYYGVSVVLSVILSWSHWPMDPI